MPDASLSPLALAMRRFRAKGGVRWGLAVLGLMCLVGIYAPFLANDVALLWWDETGLGLPILGNLFNAKSFPAAHDLLFNVTALLAPPWLLAYPLLLRRRDGPWGCCRTPTRWGATGVLAGLVLGVLCSLPVLPSGTAQDRWHALWTDRPSTAATSDTARQLTAQHGRLSAADGATALRTGDILRSPELGLVRVLSIARERTDDPVCFVAPLGGGSGSELAWSNLAVPAIPTAILPPVPHAPNRNYAGHPYAAPLSRNDHTGSRFPLGADATGRDIFARMAFGTRISLSVGLYATALSMLIGVVIGAASGYFGGWTDLILQRVVEIVMTLPGFIIILIVVAALGRDIFIIMTVIGLTGWPGTARLVRGEFLRQMGSEYVLAGKALGLPESRIMFRHILPNTMTPLMIGATFSIAGAVLTESGLAFIGLGDDSVPSWGGILAAGREVPKYAWMIYTPGLAIFLLVSALNLIGNGLREALDPKHAG